VSWILAIAVIEAAIVLFTALLKRAFLRCPYRRKIGAWRFDSHGAPVDECDDDGNLVRSTQRQKCRKCGGGAHIWSDYDGRELRKAGP
jgi:hypothetical protein